MIIVHVDRGLDKPYARAYWNRVDYRKRLPHVESEYACGRYPPNYPVPAIPLTVEHVFNEPPQLIDGIFIRNHEQWMVECWYRDGCVI